MGETIVDCRALEVTSGLQMLVSDPRVRILRATVVSLEPPEKFDLDYHDSVFTPIDMTDIVQLGGNAAVPVTKVLAEGGVADGLQIVRQPPFSELVPGNDVVLYLRADPTTGETTVSGVFRVANGNVELPAPCWIPDSGGARAGQSSPDGNSVLVPYDVFREIVRE